MTSRLRVGIDAHMVGGQETGNETYVRGLIDGLKAIDPPIDCVIFNVAPPWTSINGQIQFQRLLTGRPFIRLGLELPMRSLRFDVLHMTYAAPLWSSSRVVLTVHDICYTTHPEWFSPRDVRVLSAVVPRSIRQAAHVITDSNQARREIIDRYDVPEEKITAIPIGPGLSTQSLTTDEARAELAGLGLDEQTPYLLTVGNLQPRKNLGRLLQAFSRIKGDLHLVIVGPKHYRADDVLHDASFDQNRVHLTGYITERQLAACYQCSTAFVLPSLYEGFGLPVLEAMSRGIPVASSNAGALPEVCGDAAVMFDPLNVDEMTAAIQRIVDDRELRENLGQAGRARAAGFSWEQTARSTLRIYEKSRR